MLSTTDLLMRSATLTPAFSLRGRGGSLHRRRWVVPTAWAPGASSNARRRAALTPLPPGERGERGAPNASSICSCHSRHSSQPSAAWVWLKIFRLTLFGLVLSGLLIFGFAGTADAITFATKDFETLVAEAEQIVVGRVTGASSQKLSSGTIVTDIVFALDRVLKGASAPTFVLRVVGGTVGPETLDLPGVPKFRPGARYVVFVKGNGRTVFPVVGGSRGVFQVVPDAKRGVDVVVDAYGAPLTTVSVPLAALVEATETQLGLR
jgi:hypothetical protein